MKTNALLIDLTPEQEEKVTGGFFSKRRIRNITRKATNTTINTTIKVVATIAEGVFIGSKAILNAKGQVEDFIGW